VVLFQSTVVRQVLEALELFQLRAVHQLVAVEVAFHWLLVTVRSELVDPSALLEVQQVQMILVVERLRSLVVRLLAAQEVLVVLLLSQVVLEAVLRVELCR
jgi:hypothetical protein